MTGDARNKRRLPANVDNLDWDCFAGLFSGLPAILLQTLCGQESRLPDFESVGQASESR
jgi:hypothetical protein